METTLSTVPPNYHEVLYWKLTGSVWRLIGINLLALPLAFIAGAVFLTLGTWAGASAWDGVLALNLFILLLTIIVTLGLHELAHGLAMMAFGAKPRYGIKLEALALYATAPGHAFTRNQYLVLILAPLVSLSLLAVVAIGLLAGTIVIPALVVGAVINVAGACGDVYMAWLTVCYPVSAYVIDEEDGMRVFLPDRTTG